MAEDIGSHPIVSELARRIAELNGKMEKLSEVVKPARDAYDRSLLEKEEMRRVFERRLADKGRETRELERIANECRNELANIRWEKDSLDREMREEMDRLLAEQRLLEADEKWTKYLDENEWLWISKARTFQMEGIRFMAGARDRGLFGVANFDQMGLGKTLQAEAVLDLLQAEHAIMCAEHDLSHDAALYVVPASVKDSTCQELRKWNASRPVGVLEGNPAQRSAMVKLAHQYGMTLVVNYEQLRTCPDILWIDPRVDRQGNCVGKDGGVPTPRPWSYVVLDEAHKFKNDGAALFKLVETLCLHAEVIFPMTGTPIMNRPEEFWAILHMLTLKGKYEGKFEKKQRFINEYCYQWGRNETVFRPLAADELMKNVRNMCIRRTKAEVLKELPPKVGGITRFKENPDELVRYVELVGEQKKLYDMMRDRFMVWLDSQQTDQLTAPVVIAQFTRLRQLALYPQGVKAIRADESEVTVQCTESAKFDECLDLMDELGVAEGTKVLIFTSYEDEVINALKQRILERFPTYDGSQGNARLEIGRITGKENAAQKLVTQDRFTNPEDNLRVVIGTTRAMGIGLNLQGACSDAIFLDYDWNPGIIEQAEDRLHRQGQTENVNIHSIQASNTIDGYIMQKLLKKLDMISGVVDRKELRQAIEEGLI